MSTTILDRIKRSHLRGNLTANELRSLSTITGFQERLRHIRNGLVTDFFLELPKSLITSVELSEYLLLMSIAFLFEERGLIEESKSVERRAKKIKHNILSASVDSEDPNPLDVEHSYTNITEKIKRKIGAELLKKFFENG